MSDHVAPVPSVTPANIPASPVQPTVPAASASADAARYRLVIEAANDGFVYKTVDRQTGEVVRQWPREEVQKLAEDPTYRQGRIIVADV